MDLQLQKLFYQQAVEVWQSFCELHKSLYDLTCDEYIALLSGDIESLEIKLKEKESVIANVTQTENLRRELIKHLNLELSPENQINKAHDLLKFMEELDNKMDIPVLQRLNLLLIDMVEKIQQQNKKNQVFLNKAMFSLRELKDGFKGKKQYVTYGANGMASRTLAK
jgi:flagellar biosynthesis/type III secretory pathway chaperone